MHEGVTNQSTYVFIHFFSLKFLVSDAPIRPIIRGSHGEYCIINEQYTDALQQVLSDRSDSTHQTPRPLVTNPGSEFILSPCGLFD